MCIDLHKTGFVGEGSDHLQLIKFWPSCAPGKGVCGGAKIFGPPYYSQRAVFASLWGLFHFLIDIKLQHCVVVTCTWLYGNNTTGRKPKPQPIYHQPDTLTIALIVKCMTELVLMLSLASFGLRSFGSSGPTAWNDMPFNSDKTLNDFRQLCSALLRSSRRARLCDSLLLSVHFEMSIYYYYYCDFVQRPWSDAALFTALYKLTILHYVTYY